MDADELGPARQFPPRDVGQPVAQFGDRAAGIAAMSVDVHARQIRDEALVAILLDVELAELMIAVVDHQISEEEYLAAIDPHVVTR